MHSHQTVSGTQRGRRVQGRLLGVTAVAIAAAAAAASAAAAPAVADPTSSQTAGLGVRVVGTVTVDPSHVGVIVAVPGSGGPLNAQAFRLWQNGRPQAVRVDPLPASALRIAVVVDAGPGAQLQGAQNAVADLMIGLPNGAGAAVVGARPARIVRPLTGDAGSVVQALAGATLSGPRDDASALALAVREVLRGPPGRRAVVLITTTPIPAALASDVSGQLRAADASLYVAAVPEVAPSLARLASASGGWAVTASSARSLMPAVDAIGADLAHQYQLAYATTSAGADRDPSSGGGGRRGDDSNRRSDRAGAGLVRLVRSASARPRRRARDCWCVCGLADRCGVAVVPGRRGHRRSTAAMA